MVEELLEFFVCEVDAKLFECVEFENFETSNIKNTNEEGSWEICGKSTVDNNDQPVEKTLEHGPNDFGRFDPSKR